MADTRKDVASARDEPDGERRTFRCQCVAANRGPAGVKPAETLWVTSSALDPPLINVA